MWQKALNLKAEEDRLLPQESLAAVLGADTAAGMQGCCEHLAPLPAPVPVVSVPARGGAVPQQGDAAGRSFPDSESTSGSGLCLSQVSAWQTSQSGLF